MKAFVEINDPHVALRLRQEGIDANTQVEIMRDAREIMLTVERVADFKALRPRLSVDSTSTGAYLEFNNIDGDTNQVGDTIKETVADLGYELTTEKFPI